MPFRLSESQGISHIGSVVNGMGWLLTSSDAKKVISEDARYARVIFPYMNGSDLNSTPESIPTRWTINFFDWPIEQARSYEVPFSIVEEKVKPHRRTVRRETYRTRWWQYAERQERLYEAISSLSRTLIIAQTSKTLAFTFVSTNYVFSHMTVVIASDSSSMFALLQSNLHTAWVLQYAASLKGDARYIPTDCFETFPFPSKYADLTDLGERYFGFRSESMLKHRNGLTRIYNRFHDPVESCNDIHELRDLHVEMDKAVAASYGWDDLDLGHGFHETKQGIRFTISEAARREVLSRLLKLNHERYAEEVRQGLHDKINRSGNVRSTRGRTKSVNDKDPSLFNMEG